MQPAYTLTEFFFGAHLRTDAPESDVAVGVAVVELIPNNGRRVKLELCNTGATTISIRRDPGVTLATGFNIAAGASYIIDWQHDYAEVCKALYAIGSAAGGTVHIREIVSVR